jgi:pyruvate,water dikinase
MADMPHVVWIDDANDAPPGCLGGKFGSLAEMTSAGFAVPPGFGITTGAFRRFSEDAGLIDELKSAGGIDDPSDLAAIEAASRHMAAAIDAAALPTDVEDEVRSAYAALERRTGVAGVPVAVRSSGENEDLAGASFAGQYDTYLWVSGADALIAHVRKCWAGLFGPQVLTYRPDGDTTAVGVLEKTAMCVGVQQMVASRSAGVMFTLDPVTGDRSKVVVEGCWGLGEGVVSGDVTPDRFRIDKVTFEVIERAIGAKEQEHVFDAAAGGVVLRDVPDERRAQTCLSDAELVELAKLAKSIEKHKGAPQDIEWAVDHQGSLHLLQVRPETVHSQKPVKPIVESGTSAVQHVMSRFMFPTGKPKTPGAGA